MDEEFIALFIDFWVNEEVTPRDEELSDHECALADAKEFCAFLIRRGFKVVKV